MKTGTKSLLFGVHQFIWHPITVALAWRNLYNSWPSWREAVCIVVHDWGYWGCDKMDDENGERHPILGATLVRKWLDHETGGICETCRNGASASCFDPFKGRYGRLVLLHSRHLAKRLLCDPSPLCWPDKLSHIYYPTWLYWFLSGITGEVKEYKAHAEVYCNRPLTNWQYALWIKSHFRKIAEQRLRATASTSSIVTARESASQSLPP